MKRWQKWLRGNRVATQTSCWQERFIRNNPVRRILAGRQRRLRNNLHFRQVGKIIIKKKYKEKTVHHPPSRPRDTRLSPVVAHPTSRGNEPRSSSEGKCHLSLSMGREMNAPVASPAQGRQCIHPTYASFFLKVSPNDFLWLSLLFVSLCLAASQCLCAFLHTL